MYFVVDRIGNLHGLHEAPPVSRGSAESSSRKLPVFHLAGLVDQWHVASGM